MSRKPFTRLTHSLAQQALELHRVALATDEIRTLQSPASGTRPEDGVDRPTEDAALCPRRQHVVSEVAAVSAQLADAAERLEHALDVWSGHGHP